jgi:hypothetical protein
MLLARSSPLKIAEFNMSASSGMSRHQRADRQPPRPAEIKSALPPPQWVRML